MRQRMIGFAIVAFSLFLPSCGGNSTSPTVDPVVGSYNLVSINGFAVPVRVSLTSTKEVVITASTLVIDSSRGFTNTTTYRTTESGQVTSTAEKCTGTFFLFGASLAFTETTAQNTTCGSRYTGVWDGVSQIAVDFDPTTHAVFVK